MNNNQIIDMQCNETTGRIMRPVAYIKSDFTSKFGIPRQSGLADLEAEIHFYPEYQNPEAVRGLEEYSHLWLIWEFSQAIRKEWSPTVRPPKLGGNTRVGVFATHIQGADLLDGTPIYDIKPYIPYADSHPEARGSFATAHRDDHLQVQFPPELLNKVPQSKQKSLIQILALDPRPAYQQDPERIYGFPFAGLEIKFRVEEETLYVCEVNKEERKQWKKS